MPLEGIDSADGASICIGAGPAGLTAAYLLSAQNLPVVVLESDPSDVGGISRTVAYKDFLFDIGGHRFYTRSPEVEALWDEMLPEPFLVRKRKSRILYRGKLFDYPLRVGNVLVKLGPLEAARCVASYIRAVLVPRPPARTFEDWVTARFGRRLFETFFKTYTEKVWGMKCSEISADWAAQRIKGLSLMRAVWASIRPQQHNGPRGAIIKTLVDRFRYPRRGPGMLWVAAAARIRSRGGRVKLGCHVEKLSRDAHTGLWTVTARTVDGGTTIERATHVISSMPLRHLVRAIEPPLRDDAIAAADALSYRDFILVALIIRDRGRLDDNWIYVHEPGVRVGRIQNFKSWSPDMVPDPDLCCYGMEYFCFEHDGLWAMTDSDLVRLAGAELVRLGLAAATDILDGTVLRQPKAYPVYDANYADRVAIVRAELARNCPGLHLVGRNGMHKYNNQDHAMMTAMLTVRNIVAGRMLYDVWRVNQDAEYVEDASSDEGGRLVPVPVAE